MRIVGLVIGMRRLIVGINNMKTILKYILWLAIAYIILDICGAIAWILSGQYPDFNSYYLGKLTITIIKIIISLL